MQGYISRIPVNGLVLLKGSATNAVTLGVIKFVVAGYSLLQTLSLVQEVTNTRKANTPKITFFDNCYY